jgi:hypothetical protein
MTALADSIYRRSTLWLDLTHPVVVGGVPLVQDRSPNGLLATMVNFVAPNYGFTAGSRRIGLAFNGTTQRLTLPLAFYNAVQTNGITVVVYARYNDPTAADVVFSCRDAGGTRGWLLTHSTAARMAFTGYTAAAAVLSSTDTADAPLVGRQRLSAYSFDQGSASSLHLYDGSPVASTIAGSTAAIGYDATVVPTVGCTPGGGGQFFDGTLYHLSVWPWNLSVSEARELTYLILDGGV